MHTASLLPRPSHPAHTHNKQLCSARTHSRLYVYNTVCVCVFFCSCPHIVCLPLVHSARKLGCTCVRPCVRAYERRRRRRRRRLEPQQQHMSERVSTRVCLCVLILEHSCALDAAVAAESRRVCANSFMFCRRCRGCRRCCVVAGAWVVSNQMNVCAVLCEYMCALLVCRDTHVNVLCLLIDNTRIPSLVVVDWSADVRMYSMKPVCEKHASSPLSC